jgi:mRNA interferase MazF
VNPTRGEVWLYERPDRKPRPVLVVTRAEAIDSLSRILVVPATRSVRNIPTHVHLDESDGMREPCALALDNIFAPRKALLTQRIAKLGPERMAEVCRALRMATSC